MRHRNVGNNGRSLVRKFITIVGPGLDRCWQAGVASTEDHRPHCACKPVERPGLFVGGDIATGEMTLLMGNREVSFRDPELIARFMEAAS
jgi:hypothetical protein